MMCCVKASFLVLCFCFFMHASTTPPTIPTSHSQKIEVKKQLEFGPNERLSFRQNMPIKSTAEDLFKKYRAIQGGRSRADHKSPLYKNKALMQWARSEEEWRWADVKVRSEMEAQHSSHLSEEDLSATDYQPPRRKAPIHN